MKVLLFGFCLMINIMSFSNAESADTKEQQNDDQYICFMHETINECKDRCVDESICYAHETFEECRKRSEINCRKMLNLDTTCICFMHESWEECENRCNKI